MYIIKCVVWWILLTTDNFRIVGSLGFIILYIILYSK